MLSILHTVLNVLFSPCFFRFIGIPCHIDVLMVMQETVELYSCYLFLFLIILDFV